MFVLLSLYTESNYLFVEAGGGLVSTGLAEEYPPF